MRSSFVLSTFCISEKQYVHSMSRVSLQESQQFSNSNGTLEFSHCSMNFSVGLMSDFLGKLMAHKIFGTVVLYS